jgi:uncharacterized protein YegL
MSEFDQIPFDAAVFADNPEPRCACLLLLDTSSSMAGQAITQLNQGLVTFKDELMADSLAVKRAEVGVLGFGPVRIHANFATADQFVAPTLQANGDTPMGAAILQAIEMVRLRKEVYKTNGISYYRPWIFMITDGAPTDSWQQAAVAVRQGEQQKSFAFYAVGVEGANFEILSQISTRQPLKLKGLRFRDLFSWLSSSMASVSRSQPGETTTLTNPIAPDGWASVG